MDLSEYAEALGDLQPGDAAEFELSVLSTRAAKRRLGQAAAQRGYRLKWAGTSLGDRLYFQVLPGAKAGLRRTNGRRKGTRSVGGQPAQPDAAAASKTAPVRRRRPRRATAR
jgi:hypothetical protein